MKKVTLKKLAIATGVAAAIAAPASQASIIDNPFFRVLGVVIVWGADSTGTSPIASDFVLMNTGSTNAGADIISGDVHAVVTGSLVAFQDESTTAATDGSIMNITGATSGGVFTDGGATAGFLDATDSLTAFGLDTSTDVGLLNSTVTHSFYVASNTAFDINATTAVDANNSGDLGSLGLAGIGYDLAVTVSGDDGLAFGGNAQNPGISGTGPVTGETLLSINNSIVFDGGQRTAASTGNLAAQSVRFDATYTLGGATGYDLSDGTGLLAADVTYTIFVP